MTSDRELSKPEVLQPDDGPHDDESGNDQNAGRVILDRPAKRKGKKRKNTENAEDADEVGGSPPAKKKCHNNATERQNIMYCTKERGNILTWGVPSPWKCVIKDMKPWMTELIRILSSPLEEGDAFRTPPETWYPQKGEWIAQLTRRLTSVTEVKEDVF